MVAPSIPTRDTDYKVCADRLNPDSIEGAAPLPSHRPGGPPHRKRIKHYDIPVQARMFTFSCYRRLALLLDDRWRLILARSLLAAAAGHGWTLIAFVFMPEHVHLVMLPAEGASGASRLLYAIKRPASSSVKRALVAAGDPLVSRLTVLERPGKYAFRFWQEGPGYDENLRSEDHLINAINYVHRNPVTRGLSARPEDWAWSSARQYGGQDVPLGAPEVKRWSWGNGLRQPGDPSRRVE